MRRHPRRPTSIGKQHEKGERCACLREDDRLDRMERLTGKSQFSGKDGAAECGGNSPQERCRCDEKVSAQGMRGCQGWNFWKFRVPSPNPMMGPDRATGQGDGIKSGNDFAHRMMSRRGLVAAELFSHHAPSFRVGR